MIFCSCSFSLMFYGINFLRPASGYFLYLVSKGRSTERIECDNSVSFHHAIFAHQCRNPKRIGIRFFKVILKNKREYLYSLLFYYILWL